MLPSSPHVKDLGVYVSEDLSWKYHISQKVNDAKKFCGWILRTFVTRKREAILLLFKSLVISRIEYCSPLWSPTQATLIQQIESVQRTITSKIEGMKDYNYWERLEKLNLYSLQRRRERFIIIHMWKILNNLVPNDIGVAFIPNDRLGPTCYRMPYKSSWQHLNTLRYNSFISKGSALFNILPKEIKLVDSMLLFKSSLDVFLRKYPDTPPTPGYTPSNSNSLLDWSKSGITNKTPWRH